MMKLFPTLLTASGLTLSALNIFAQASTASDVKASTKPNIVFILADDLGYGELGCYGQEKIKTPHVDQLCKEGMKFSQHYTGAPVCAPARCVLMTGKHLAHAEIRGNKDSKNGKKFPGQWPITAEALTIAEVLKDAGYVTGAFGKWGLGPAGSSGDPNKQGFDRYYGFICQRNAHSFYPPYLDSDGEEITINKNPIPGHSKKLEGEVKADDYRDENYAGDLVLAEALKFIDTNKDKPFFLYLPFIEPHVSMHPPQEWVDRYPKEWDKKPYRGTRGYIPHPRPRAGYAAMISDLDEHVGAVMARLKKHGLEDNTIVIFTSDNGATHDVGGVDTTFFNSVNGLRGLKGSCYEGGIRIPCVVKWPGKAKAGSTTDAASYFPDWFPTLTEIGGGKMPAQKLDGVSLSQVIKGGALPKRHEPMIWEFNGYGGIIAVRDGKWKAIRRGLKGKKGPSPWELYDIDADPKEKNDLSKKHPERVQRLEKMWLETRTKEPDFPVPMVDKK
ncbi:MAG: arylsulfatase [Akkermansiaceae bacterium]|jgi:arylsulfatase A|tara:strand:+ start:15673 stop:17172 length:1500 start_codon:yes stop_codon:yes gene_type:complete